MAKHILHPYVAINDTKIAGVRAATVSAGLTDVESIDGDSVGHERIAGLRDDSVSLELAQDYAVAGVDSVLWPLFDGGTEFQVTVADATGGTFSPTAPAWEGSGIITKYGPQDGAPGTLAALKVDIVINGKLHRRTT